MKEKKPPHVPTRLNPHRWCKALHIAPAPFALAVAAFALWHNWLLLLIFAAIITLNVWVTKVIHWRPAPRSRPASLAEVVKEVREVPSPMQMHMEDAKYAGTGWRMLEVRKGWARVAVGMDIFWVVLIGWGCTHMLADPASEAAAARHVDISVGTLLGFLPGAALFAFTVYAHKKATQPRKPKRAWLPAFLRTNV